ncbi:hypothetical protein [Cryptosporangium arvum]|uniref:Uncharacterized protein n=1 Tax=Cryptosporangium arvum DSM 44712 TaxID=927661 RepID=A0A010ZTG0_9ACTN|nr:hypothetical protein [Cryptosporangium arvum]EXG81994.1 hypothetical protein CryarDRAFT_3123 [Cryptosporangium arvum DSM 44712]
MISEQPAPTRAEVDAWFTGVLDGSRTRDAADQWAATWLHSPTAIDDEVIWSAIGLLGGIDLESGPDGSLLHDDDQVRQWQSEFRRRCAASPTAEN